MLAYAPIYCKEFKPFQSIQIILKANKMNYLQNAHPYPGYCIQLHNVQFITSGFHIISKSCVFLYYNLSQKQD